MKVDKLEELEQAICDTHSKNIKLRELCKVELNGLAEEPVTRKQVRKNLIKWALSLPLIKGLSTVIINIGKNGF